ncbi:MAG: TonB-dependent receptor [Gammaproteobacteria bacterium]|nr:TonB-dependent receptor [Gammaproteobacteria bacterium]
MKPFLPLFLSALPALATTAFAQTTSDSESIIEEIVVTSEFRDVSLMKSAGSISVVSLNDRKSGTLNHLEEVLGLTPNVNFASGGSRARFYQIRGIGERGQFIEPLNSSVGLVLDGVDMSGVGTVATLFDVSQVEVLRGPQGTLFGANALAGLINVISNDPTREFTARLDVDAGDYAALGMGAIVSGPISDTVGYRLAVRKYRDDGFMDNKFLNTGDTNDHDELTMRGKLAWEPDDQTAWLLTLGKVDVDNGYDAFSLDNNRNTLSDEPGDDKQDSTYASLKLNRELASGLTFEGLIGYGDSAIDYGYDEDWAFAGFHPWGYSSTDRYRRDRTTRTLDLRLLSGDTPRIFSGTTEWVLGVYMLSQEVDLRRTYTYLTEDYTSTFDMDRFAVYGELTSSLSERSRITFGLRGERHRADFHDSDGGRDHPTVSMVGGRVVFTWDVTDRTLFYASATRGYKAGGFNTDGTLDEDLRHFDPETLWNFEVGLKGVFLDGRSRVRLSAFTMQRREMQVATSIVRVRADGSAEFIDFTGNAADGINSGLELELLLNVSANLNFFGSLGLLYTEFDDYTNGSGEDLDGRDQAHAPGYQFHLGGDYLFAPGWFLRVEVEGKDDFYFSDGHDLQSDSFAIVNVSLGYGGDRWQAILWGRNLSDEDYFVRGFFFGNDPRDGYTERGFTQLGDPRRFGLSLSFEL